MRRYGFIAAEQAWSPLARLGRVLAVARAGYDAWRRRGLSQRAQAAAALTKERVRRHGASRQTDGASRLHADLAAAGHPTHDDHRTRRGRGAARAAPAGHRRA